MKKTLYFSFIGVIYAMLLLWGNQSYAKETTDYASRSYVALANGNLTDSVVLSNFKILNSNGTPADDISGNTERLENLVVIYSLDWDLSSLGGTVLEGDYLDIEVPTGLGKVNNSNSNITANGVVVGSLVLDTNTNRARVTFNKNVEGMANFSGNAQIPVTITLNKGDNHISFPDGSSQKIIYTYNPADNPADNGGKGVITGDRLAKTGFSIYEDYIQWQVLINRSKQDFGTSEVVVEDRLETASGSFVSVIPDSFILRKGVVYPEPVKVGEYRYSTNNDTKRILITTSKAEYDEAIANGGEIAYLSLIDGGKIFRLYLGNKVGNLGYLLEYKSTLPPDDTKVTNGATLLLDNKETLPYDTKDGEPTDNTTVKEGALTYRLPSSITYADVKDRIVITKYDIDNGTRLAGATFEVRNSNNVVVATLTTGNDGTIQSGILDAGIYTLTEIVAPDGYALLRTPISVELKYNQPSFVNISGRKASAQTHCVRPANTAGTGLNTIVGITTLGRAEGKGNITDDTQWPMLRKGGWIALESNTKGFVVTRMNTNEIKALTAQEGMMVFDTDAKCLKIYDGTDWACFSTPACPTN